MTKLERLEELKIQYEQLCWLIEHTETTTQLKLLKEVCSGFQFKDEKDEKIAKEEEIKKVVKTMEKNEEIRVKKEIKYQNDLKIDDSKEQIVKYWTFYDGELHFIRSTDSYMNSGLNLNEYWGELDDDEINHMKTPITITNSRIYG